MNAPYRQGIPLRPDRDSIRDLSMRSLSRAAIAVAQRAYDGGMTPSIKSPDDFLRQRGWEGDRVAGLLTKAASAPAMTTTAGWAAELATVAMSYLASLRPMSAAAQLLAQCLQISLDGVAQVKLPAIDAGSANFVAQGAPIRVLKMVTSAGPTISMHKLASICELSREMMESGNAEAIRAPSADRQHRTRARRRALQQRRGRQHPPGGHPGRRDYNHGIGQ
jgi:hypothetical protein